MNKRALRLGVITTDMRNGRPKIESDFAGLNALRSRSACLSLRSTHHAESSLLLGPVTAAIDDYRGRPHASAAHRRAHFEHPLAGLLQASAYSPCRCRLIQRSADVFTSCVCDSAGTAGIRAF